MTVERQAASIGGVGARGRASRLARAMTWIAWALIGAGILVALYLVYSLFFTNLQTEAEQSRLLEEWESSVGAADVGQIEPVDDGPQPVVTPDPTPTVAPTPAPTSSAPAADDPVIADVNPEPPSGEAVAVLWFERPGGAPPVSDEPYVVVSGVTLADLAKGPGHYQQTAGPGEEGNFAVAGHRTTNGAPFFHLDQLREGDEIHVMDTAGEEHVYAFREQRIVAPTNGSVLRANPLGDTGPTITLTTCHPRFSNRQRLIVFGELMA